MVNGVQFSFIVHAALQNAVKNQIVELFFFSKIILLSILNDFCLLAF